jgi:transcriptional regulator with XRE-family HTH domain
MPHKPDQEAIEMATTNSDSSAGKSESRREEIGLRLRTARQMAGLTQGQVARLLNLHRPSVSEAEAGHRRVPTEELAEYARIYGVSPSWLSGFGPDKLEPGNPRVELAARELGKLKPEDLDRVLHLLAALRSTPEASE